MPDIVLPSVRARKIKAVKVRQAKERSPRKTTTPRPENTDPTIPKFSVAGLEIQGKAVGSALEWNVAAALDMVPIGYRYQVSVLGGRMRGGSVVDFEAFTRPTSTYIFAQGDYWHTRGNKEDEDQLLFARIEAAYNKRVVQIWEHEALTVQMALATIKTKLKV